MSQQTDYIASINNALVKYSYAYMQKRAIGSLREQNWSTIKLIYAHVIKDILEEFLLRDTGDAGFFDGDTDKPEQLMRHFNGITKTNYFLVQS